MLLGGVKQYKDSFIEKGYTTEKYITDLDTLPACPQIPNDFLLIDELGYVEVEPSQVGLFFTLMNKRHKKNHTLITSNLGFSQWTSFLKNTQLTAALIDRLTENSHVINMKECVSLRPKLNPM